MSAERLPDPIRDALRVEVDEAEVPRLWRRVEEHRRRMRRARSIRWKLPGLALAAVLVLLVTVGALRLEPSGGPLRYETGGEVGRTLAAGAVSRFHEGSWIRVGRDTELHVLESSDSALVLHLVEGRLELDVRPGGPRRWTVEAGDASVEVVGTRFTVRRQGPRVAVAVQRGAVLVRHAELVEGLRRLEAGESLVTPVPRRSAAPAAPPPAPAALPAAPVAEPALPDRAPRPRPDESRRWREHAQRGEYDAAYALLGPDGAGRAALTASPEDLMQLADVALLSGHPADALAPLNRLLERHRDHASAPLAAFTLGRIELDRLGRHAAAAEHFELALRSGLASTLVDDARARLAIARHRGGYLPGARSAACEYLDASPNGLRATSMRAICEAP